MASDATNHLLVSRTASEVRVVLCEQGKATICSIERSRQRGIVGNIYQGRVVRVVPGMQSAFVDIGVDRAAFLYVGDLALPGTVGQRRPLSPDTDADAEAPVSKDDKTPGGVSADVLADLALVDEASAQLAGEPTPPPGPLPPSPNEAGPWEGTIPMEDTVGLLDRKDEPTWADGSRVDWRVGRGRGSPEALVRDNAPTPRAQAPVPSEGGEDRDEDAEITQIPLGDPSTEPDPEDGPASTSRRPAIQQLLSSGQAIVVQVSKEALGTKGPRLTTNLAIPGRFLVYVPGGEQVGVSRRIRDGLERDRLRGILEGVRRPGEGFIVRTACEGRSEDVLLADTEYLRELWSELRSELQTASTPSLVHQELDLVLRVTRDLLSADVDAMILDDPGDYRRVVDFAQRFMSSSVEKIKLHQDERPLLEATGVAAQLSLALERRVPLPSGGHIVIDPTEALTAVDVNSGRYVGGRNLEETTTRVNLEAVDVIAHQLRLRDIGGIIVIDFIDMEDAANRARVNEALSQALELDQARCMVLPLSEFGLAQITRRRVRENLARNLLSTCRSCTGTGQVKSSETVAYEVLREIARNARKSAGGIRELVVRCEPSVGDQLERKERSALSELERALRAPIRIQREKQFHRERFAVSFMDRNGKTR